MCKKDQSLDARRYAVKFIEDKGEQLSKEALEREALLLSQLDHEHVVQQIEAFWHTFTDHDGDEVKQFVIVMELLSGGSLKAKIVEPPPPAAETAEWMRQVTLAIVHSQLILTLTLTRYPRFGSLYLILSLSLSLTLALALTLTLTLTRWLRPPRTFTR